MSEEEAKKWVKVKANQAQVINQFFKDYPPKQGRIGYFMAGIPGAGKTEFAENTIRESAPVLVPIEHDKLVEYIPQYKPENYYNYRKAGSALVTAIFDICLKNGYAFVFDGTLAHENGIRNVEKALKANYGLFIIYIVQDAKMAWKLTQDRELVKKRAIEKNGFVDTCNKINTNLLHIFSMYKNIPKFNFWIINKRGALGMENATAIMHGYGLDQSPEIEKELGKSYNIRVIE